MSEGPGDDGRYDGPDNSENDDSRGWWVEQGEDEEVPERFESQHTSYYENLMPFAMDPNLSDEQFGFFQDLYYQGFVSVHDQGARSTFIGYLNDYYDLDFDWDAWREEYESV